MTRKVGERPGTVEALHAASKGRARLRPSRGAIGRRKGGARPPRRACGVRHKAYDAAMADFRGRGGVHPQIGGGRVVVWLSRRRLLDAALSVTAAGALLVLGTAAVAAYFVFFHSLLLMVFGRWQFFTEALGAGISFGLIALLFAASRLTGRRHLDELCVETGSDLGDKVMRRAHRPMRACAMSALEPLPASFAGKVGAAILLGGPRLVAAAFRLLARALRLLRMDVHACARVIALVYGRGERVPFEDIARAIAEANLVKVLAQLADIEGVMFHASEPAGISLTDRLRGEIEGAAGQHPT